MGRARCADGVGAWCEGWREMGRLEACLTLREGPRMTTSLQTDPRRTARDAFRKPGRPPLEMPVLFQLADLSVQHVKVAPPSPPVSAVAAPSIAEPVIAAPLSPIEEVVLAKVPNEVEAPKEETLTITPTVVETPVLEATKTEPQPEVVISQAITDAVSPTASTEAESNAEASIPKAEEPSAEFAATPTAVSETSVTDVTPPTEATAPSPRDKAEHRAKRQPAPAHSDWMRTHGKYIAVAFVFALIATIYLAQNGDEPSPASPNAASSTNAEAEAKTPGESETKVTDAYAAKESIPVTLHNHSPSLLEETSPATGNPAAEAHAQLHAPKGGHTIKEPPQPTEIADSKSLFPWKEAEETRVAAKPAGPRAKPQTEPVVNQPKLEANEKASAGEPSIEETPSIYGPPSSQQHQPAAAQPASEKSELNALNRYPATDPNRYREFEPPPGRSATPASYQPGPQNTAPPSRTSGPRYERTGSGLY